MNILIESESWLRGLAGGTLIGVSAALLMLASGRVAGISGIVGGLVFERGTGNGGWRLWFLLGLVAAPLLVMLFGQMQPVTPVGGWGAVLLAGALVGFGTRLGNGCTSGHGICGLARFSRRSFAATLTFMAFGFLTVLFVRHGGGL